MMLLVIIVSACTIPLNLEIAASTFTIPAEMLTCDACTLTSRGVLMETP